ncbi:hypothetical protein M404DRAFT_726858 [Pisolithus tinctorius Marx 270]|uniref:Uncharacterized protein n=1 Tax=Pisolithus tinctorius Marx 270 TaxID=870435 RepID=A0A0C3P216_PISTI|nr:hypothetical protein M404DRAFT_726858 [Pisolithus tinctorius Marx 270]
MLYWNCTLAPFVPSRWLNAQSSQEHLSSKTSKQLHDTLYRAGIEALLSVEDLRQPADTLLDALSRMCMDHSLSLLPCLFSARLCAVNRHRTTFSPSSSGLGSPALAIRDVVRADAMEVWESCRKVLLRGTVTVDSGPQRTDAWMTLVGILDVIEEEHLYTLRTTIGSGNRNTAPSRDVEFTLIEAKELALATVERTGQVCNSNDMFVVTLAIDVLDVLVGVEYELIGGELQRLLGAIVGLPHPLSVQTTDPVQRLLSDLLDYHTETRTVHAYILTPLTALSSLTLPKIGAGCLEEFTRA